MSGVRLAAVIVVAAVLIAAAAGCGSVRSAAGHGDLSVVASTSFLADIAQNVAGERFTVTSLVPRGADPHSFEPAPSDPRTVAGADLLIVNGAGLEGPLLATMKNTGTSATVVDASAGLRSRTPKAGEPPLGSGQTDPHFWLDPVLAETYVDNIRDAFAAADPAGAAAYRRNAAAYNAKLRELDRWIRGQVSTIPAARRKLVTDHAAYGYFADRFGFRVVGTVLPGVSSDETPSARQLADLTAAIRRSGAPAIFVDSGENPQLAEQIGRETGVTVVTDLIDHSLTTTGGSAPTYLEMLRYDTRRIVEALR